jgi:hypothetical protein
MMVEAIAALVPLSDVFITEQLDTFLLNSREDFLAGQNPCYCIPVGSDIFVTLMHQGLHLRHAQSGMVHKQVGAGLERFQVMNKLLDPLLGSPDIGPASEGLDARGLQIQIQVVLFGQLVL